MKDYYKTLCIEFGASEVEIKRGFRKQASIHHPDKNAGSRSSEEKFKEILNAYQVLSTDKKKAYDQSYLQHFKKPDANTSNSHSKRQYSEFKQKYQSDVKQSQEPAIKLKPSIFRISVILAIGIWIYSLLVVDGDYKEGNDRHDVQTEQTIGRESSGATDEDSIKSLNTNLPEKVEEVRPESGELKF